MTICLKPGISAALLSLGIIIWNYHVLYSYSLKNCLDSDVYLIFFFNNLYFYIPNLFNLHSKIFEYIGLDRDS